MDFLIMGAGAVGSAFGGFLKKGGNNVALMDPNQSHIEAIRKQGLCISGIWGDHSKRNICGCKGQGSKALLERA